MSRLIPRSIEAANEEIQINSKGWKLKGWSRAGCQTGFILYPHKILLDAGLTSSQKFDSIFITHQHVDHVHNLPLVCSRHKPGCNTIYVPKTSQDIIFKYFRLISELSSHEAKELTDEQILIHQNINIVGVNSGDVIKLEKDALIVEVLEAFHDVQSNGYGFNSCKRVIKPEFSEIIELKQIDKIKELKEQKIEMYDKILIPEFVYFCDSSIDNLTSNSKWKKYPCVIVECTGLDSDSTTSYHSHTTLVELKPIMLENLDKRWILIHVSMKVSNEKIKQIEEELKSQGIDIYVCKGVM